jgi:hypothetical protein
MRHPSSDCGFSRRTKVCLLAMATTAHAMSVKAEQWKIRGDK